MPVCRRLCSNTVTFLIQVSHTAISNAHSHIDERLARWILMAQDRTTGSTILLTHEFLQDALPALGDDLAGCPDYVGEQRKAARAKDEEGFFVFDDAFHRSLAHAADCAYAWKVVEEAKGQMDRVRFLSIPRR